MPMMRLGEFAARNPFHDFICGTKGGGCGKRMGRHWVYRPEKLGDVIPNASGRKPDGKFYCHRDQSSASGGHYQRQLRRIMAEGYTGVA
jgi:hypothetical protein